MVRRWTKFSFLVFVVAFCLLLPSPAQADGITFGFTFGKVFAQRPIGGSNPSFVTNDPAVTSKIPKNSVTTVHYVSRFDGATPPGVPDLPTLGSLNLPNTFNFGSMVFETGSLLSTTGTVEASFNPGGYVRVLANNNTATRTCRISTITTS
ncbi:MAG: hypothetical protein HY046_06315 [Acidobacteria bacterium]|nr:hypothetical protein [Acidobacteriota bacterium]